ncbi:MAG: hypothetical protein EHM91_02740 [Planctomycetota bacterium]|nr:MAG: hypothetical protein EHM91_02740 [Planctomycetota bacterium]
MDCPESLTIPGIPFIESVMVNLVDNAVRHGPPEKSARIAVQASEQAGVVQVLVTGGLPVEPEVLPGLFERYSRGPHSTGMGLGLALTREILQAAGGTADAANVPEKSGMTLQIRLTIPKG